LQPFFILKNKNKIIRIKIKYSNLKNKCKISGFAYDPFTEAIAVPQSLDAVVGEYMHFALQVDRTSSRDS
jgi:hypothetical protein